MLIERHFGSRDSIVIPELGFEVVKGKPDLYEALNSRTSWLSKWTVGVINKNKKLRDSLTMNFPQVREEHVDEFANKLAEKEFKVQGKISDFSVSDNHLHNIEKRWYQQTFKSTHLGSPVAKLIPNAEDVVEDLEESKKKGRLILSPAGLMVYEFSAFTGSEEYSGVFKQTCFIIVYESRRKNGVIALGSILRGKLERFYDDKSTLQLRSYRKEMSKRRKEAMSSHQSER